MRTNIKQRNELRRKYLENEPAFEVADIFKKYEEDEKKTQNLAPSGCIEDISKQVFDVVAGLNYDEETMQKVLDSLAGFRYIDELDEIINGRTLKTIRITPRVDASGNEIVVAAAAAVATDAAKNPVKSFGKVFGKTFTEKGCLIKCCIFGKTFISYYFDNYLTFQELDGTDLERMAYMKLLENIRRDK